MKNDMRNRHGKNLHILLSILDYIDSNISSYDTDGNVILDPEYPGKVYDGQGNMVRDAFQGYSSSGDAGEQVTAYIHDAILYLVEQRLASRSQGDDAGPFVLAAAMAFDQSVLLQLTQSAHQGRQLYLQRFGKGLLAEMTTEAAEFPQRCPAWMGQTQGRQFQVCYCAP